MRSFAWNRFPTKTFSIHSLLIASVKSSCLNTDMCKFGSSQKDESRAHPAYSSKAWSKPRDFVIVLRVFFSLQDYFCFLWINLSFLQFLFIFEKILNRSKTTVTQHSIILIKIFRVDFALKQILQSLITSLWSGC